jgi:hypothetical protein
LLWTALAVANRNARINRTARISRSARSLLLNWSDIRLWTARNGFTCLAMVD